MGHSRCSAIAPGADCRDAVGPGNAAGNATGLGVAAARALADAGSGSFAGAANPGDSDRRAAAVPVASCDSDASRCCRDGRYHGVRSSFDPDPLAGDAAYPAVAAIAGAATGASDPVAGVRHSVAVVPRAVAAPATGGSDPVAGVRHSDAVAPNAVAAAALGEPGPVAAARCSDAVAPNAAGDPL